MVARATVSASPLSVSAVAVYGLALLAMLGASAAHNCGWARAGNELRRRLDHGAIFVMIAGTYTPFTPEHPFRRTGHRHDGGYMGHGMCGRPDEAAISPPF